MGTAHTIPDPVTGEVEFRVEMRRKALHFAVCAEQRLGGDFAMQDLPTAQVLALISQTYATLACSHLQETQ